MPPAKKSTNNLDAVRDLLGTMPDHEVAKIAGSTISVVGRYRRKHRIPAYDGYKFGLGQAPPAKSDGSSGAKKSSTKKQKGGRVYTSRLDPFREIVGKLPDRVVAERAGMSTEGVRMYRRRHQIPLTVVRSAAAATPSKQRRPRPSKLDPFRDLLGNVPDREVATMAGVTSENVRAYRRKRNIPARWRGEGVDAPSAQEHPQPIARPTATKSAPARASKVASGQAYEVEVTLANEETKRYITLADSLPEAAASSHLAVAASKKGAKIISVKHLGPALS